MDKSKNMHSGHRKRLKNKVKQFGLKALSEHEIVELLLTYSISRKDTNAIAHSLLNKFSNIANVINADYNRILEVEGVGEESALFFKILSELIGVYFKSKSKCRSWIIRTTGNAIDYFRANYEVKGEEKFYILNVTKAGRVIRCEEFNGEDDTQVSLKTNDIAKLISVEGSDVVYMFHTHPGGSTKPSYADEQTTYRFIDVCGAMGIRLVDHVIFNETESYSFRSDYNIDDMYEQAVKMFRQSKLIDYEKFKINKK